MSPNLRAFLKTLTVSELGPDIIRESDRGYDVLVGSTPRDVHTFGSYADHPRVLVRMVIKGKPLNSTAAGAYQIREVIFDAYRARLRLPDFGPASQDAIALQLIGECEAREDIEAGRFPSAVHKCRSRWASLPGAGHGQHEHDLPYLQRAYLGAGGQLA